MGIATQLWLVDLDAIKSVWASRDEALLERLRDPEHRYTRALLALDEPGHKQDEMRAAVTAILIGAACDQVPRHRYHYALEAICHELRTPRGVENDVYDREVHRLEELLGIGTYEGLEPFVPVGVEWFLPLPDSEDFPFVGWVERTETAALATEAEALAARVSKALAANPESESAQIGDGWGLTELALTYRAAADADLDVVLFQH